MFTIIDINVKYLLLSNQRLAHRVEVVYLGFLIILFFLVYCHLRLHKRVPRMGELIERFPQATGTLCASKLTAISHNEHVVDQKATKGDDGTATNVHSLLLRIQSLESGHSPDVHRVVALVPELCPHHHRNETELLPLACSFGGEAAFSGTLSFQRIY
jgi:hypothetical protein